jgi:hypothetical protein
MTHSPSTNSAVARPLVRDDVAEEKILLRVDIGGKWGKFSAREILDLKDNEDLVTQLVAKYGLEKDAATRDAEAVVRGRIF